MLVRPGKPARTVTLVPLIDVLFILLVYFMVTSVYLDLDMIPASGTSETPGAASGTSDAEAAVKLIRLDRSGQAILGGRSLSFEELGTVLKDQVTLDPGLSVLIMPSPYAPMQSLAAALDAVVRAGVGNSRILNLEIEE